MSPPVSVAPQSGSADRALGLLVEELTARFQAGEPVEVEAYLQAHPEHAERLRQLLPALRLLAELGHSAATGSSAGIASAAFAQDLDELPPPPSPAAGCLGDYRILREVGRGGMGVVYEAEQISLGRRVALKVLPFAAALDAKQLQRFKNEAQAAAQLHHTNIVPVYAVGCERCVHYYAMQFIAGRTLAALIAELRRQASRDPAPSRARPAPPRAAGGSTDPQATGRSRPEEAPTQAAEITLGPAKPRSGERGPKSPEWFRSVARLGIQAAEALEHAHQLGVIHRDVKPGNLLVEGEPGASAAGLRLWVTDFGLAQVLSDTRLTLTGDLVGTLRYMSPEQALARRGLIDHRTDVYSLGVTLYELLTLEPAFGGHDRQELLRQVAFEEPSPPARHDRGVPRELETIVLKAMAKEPAERYATAGELAEDLRRFLEYRPIQARRPTWAQWVRKWVRRHRAAVATGTIAFVLLLVGAVAALTVSNIQIAQERNRTEEALLQSRASQQAATRRLKQTLEAVDRILGRADALGDLPEMEPTHRALTEDALDLFQRLLQEGASDPDLRLEMAWIYEHVGSIRVTLGQLPEAKEAYRRGVALAEDLAAEAPDRPEYRRALAFFRQSYGACLYLQGNPSEEVERETRASLKLMLGLADERPADWDCRLRLGICQRQLAHWLRDNGRTAEAEQLVRQALATHQRLAADSSANPLLFGANVLDDWYHLAHCLQELGRTPEAAGAYRDALQEAHKLKAAFPRRLAACRWLARLQQDLGKLLCDRGQQAEGRQLLAQAAATWREVPVDSRDSSFDWEGAGAGEVARGDLLKQEGRGDEAVTAFRQALDCYEEATRGAAGAWQKRQCKEEMAYCWARLAQLWRGQDRLAQAEDALRHAAAVYQQLFADFPRDGEVRRLLANSHNNLAWFLAIRPDRRPHHAALALEQAQKAVALQPGHHDWWHTLGVAHCRLGHWKEALACIEKSRQLENKPGPPGAFDRFFEAMAYSGLGDRENARRCYDEGVRWMAEHAPDHRDLRRFRDEAAGMLGIGSGP
jgi:serine/threonine protein kinase